MRRRDWVRRHAVVLTAVIAVATAGLAWAAPSAWAGGPAPRVSISAAPTVLEAPIHCRSQVLVSVTNDSKQAGFVQLDIAVPPPLTVTPARVTSYFTAGYAWTTSVTVIVPDGAPAGDYPLVVTAGRSQTSVAVTVPPGGAHCIPHAELSATATSFHANVPPSNAVDGDILSRWGVEYAPYQPGPQSITIDTGSPHDVTTLRYWPRQDTNTNGIITKYNLYTSADGETFTLAGTGSWAFDNPMKTAAVDATGVRYVRLEVTEGGRDGVPTVGGYGVAAEIELVTTSP